MRVLSKKFISVVLSLSMFFVAVLGFVSVCCISASARAEITVYPPTHFAQQLNAGAVLGWNAEMNDKALLIGDNTNPMYGSTYVDGITYREVHVTQSASLDYFWAQAIYQEANGMQHYSDRAMFTGTVASMNTVTFSIISGSLRTKTFDLTEFEGSFYDIWFVVAYCGEYFQTKVSYDLASSLDPGVNRPVNGIDFDAKVDVSEKKLIITFDRTLTFNTYSSTINQRAAVGIAFVPIEV